ncbi:DUF3017 domain-containing protein [Streptomyces sp. KS 21]|uniref:DUF3017 domain-containing protein n=1 Tax=Streptomyces sp. KS 21 TaxID=2485150 RepID=UPI0010631341|nr:DUF3017 domain-containing protein [Streptomyces sp. KS 21]TDU76446.1 DUF3017 family protein [Streptomyces sp. KS 21]
MQAEHEAEAGTGADSGTGAEAGPGAAPGTGPDTGADATSGAGRGAEAAAAAAAGTEASKSRRFPSVTKDTARPEGHGRAAPGDALAARQWPMLSVLGATAVGLLLTALGHPRAGCLVIGVALITASVLRRILPQVGMLAVRSRFTDMVTYGLLGVAITLLALVMEPHGLDIPFLEDAVHFTVR